MTELQVLLISTLRSSAAVQTALKNPTATNKSVAENQNFTVAKTVFPLITVGITSEKAINVQQPGLFNGKRISECYIEVHIFSKLNTSTESGAIDTAVRAALDGKNPANSVVACYLCEFDSMVQKERDDDTGLWHTITRYKTLAKLI